MKLLIKNGRVIDPANKLDAQMDIFVENGRFVFLSGKMVLEAEETIDATGLWVTPGLIDMHIHLRDPGQLHKETIKSGTRAAAAGGFTTVCCMPNTSPAIDSKEIVEYIAATAAKDAVVRVLPIGSITKGLAGEELSAMREMQEAGICAISDDGKTVENPAIYKASMECAVRLGLPVLAHCEDIRLGGAEAEEIVIARDIILARMTGAKLHICHVSTAHGVELIRNAQKNGQIVTAEVTPHHFTLTDEDIPKGDANYKMSPPLRSRADRAAILSALKDGTISVIATDHAPHHADEKNCEFQKAANGVIGLETAVSLAITELVETGLLTPSEMIAKFTANPAKILGIDYGNLLPSAAADITIIDPTSSHTIDKRTFQSLSKNTPFHGRKVKGQVVYTIVAGKIVFTK